MKKLRGQTLVIASHNEGKLREIAELVRPYGVSAVAAKALGLESPEETGATFEENARIKAHFVAKETGHPALSDDSGITVDALGGQPGIHTADWAETPKGRDYAMAMRKVWDMLEEKGAPEPRAASFRCALCLAWPEGGDQVFEGEVPGRLVWPPSGDFGFGFDPMFVPKGERVTFGDMDPKKKHAMSHRAEAFRKFRKACLDA